MYCFITYLKSGKLHKYSPPQKKKNNCMRKINTMHSKVLNKTFLLFPSLYCPGLLVKKKGRDDKTSLLFTLPGVDAAVVQVVLFPGVVNKLAIVTSVFLRQNNAPIKTSVWYESMNEQTNE